MKCTIDYLDALRAHFGVTSDYALAKKLGVSTGCIGNYRNGRSTFSDEMAFRIADVLGMHRGAVWLDIQAERAIKAHNAPLSAALTELRHLGGIAA